MPVGDGESSSGRAGIAPLAWLASPAVELARGGVGACCTLSVALKTLRKLLLLVSIVVHVRGHRAGRRLGRLERLAHVRRNVLVVAHVYGDALLVSVSAHVLELGHGRRAGLLEVDRLATEVDNLQATITLRKSTQTAAIQRQSGSETVKAW
eukprot:scaffold21110_cov145-Isochrysis_galbana.AAC.1